MDQNAENLAFRRAFRLPFRFVAESPEIHAAVLAERERCAKIAEAFKNSGYWETNSNDDAVGDITCDRIAELIRSGK